ncbi:MAG: bacteriohopanetetrol glucosamine biosynthesis glycosyltransferase HpnI [Bryobacterales bacterium]
MNLAFLLTAVLAVAVAGGIVFYGLVMAAAWSFQREEASIPQRDDARTPDPISVLKPLSGPEPELEANLRTFFELRYPQFELLFAVREDSDPAAAVVRRLQAEFPRVSSELTVTGEPPSPEFPNAKVFSLIAMARKARHPIVVISDSDIRAGAGYLEGIAADFAVENVVVSTCPYRAVPGRRFWSLLEALGMDTEFWGGVLVARMLGGMDFAVGPTMAVRRSFLDRIGGFERVREYLAEDFVLGRLAVENGFRAVLSHHVVEHRIGSQGFAENFRHRLRWYRSTRRSRPLGYLGQLFTNPLPLALLVAALAAGSSWSLWLLGLTALFRFGALLAVGPGVLSDRLTLRFAWLVPLQDVASFAVWCVAFFGNTIVWRDRRYKLLRDGRLRLLP